MFLNDKQIIEYVRKQNMISPFIDHKVKKPNTLSYGLEPFGYTLTLSNEFVEVDSPTKMILDPATREGIKLKKINASSFILQPNSFVLGKAIEYLRMPEDVTGLALTKSSYARVGVFANITAIDAGWEGFLTIEIANLGQFPVVIHALQGIAQIHFVKGEIPQSLYKGRYQKLKGVKV